MSKLVVKALTTIIAMQVKATVQLISMFLLGSRAVEIKAVSLDLVDGYGSAKTFFTHKDKKKQLQRIIYHLIINAIIKEELTGTALKPTILLSVGNASDLMNDKLTVLV